MGGPETKVNVLRANVIILQTGLRKLHLLAENDGCQDTEQAAAAPNTSPQQQDRPAWN